MPVDGEPHLRAADGLPEIDVESVFKIGTRFAFRRLCLRGSRTLSPEELLKKVAEPAAGRRSSRKSRRPARSAGKVLKIEAVEIHLRSGPETTLPTGGDVVGIESVLVVDLSLLRVVQDVVRFLHFLEAVLGHLVPGV